MLLLSLVPHSNTTEGLLFAFFFFKPYCLVVAHLDKLCKGAYKDIIEF